MQEVYLLEESIKVQQEERKKLYATYITFVFCEKKINLLKNLFQLYTCLVYVCILRLTISANSIKILL